MGTIYEMDMANLFVGDAEPDKSEFLTIRSVKLPMLQEKTTEHSGGGAMAGLRIGMKMLEVLELTFSLRGYNLDVMNKLMIGERQKYTMLGNVRDLKSDREFPSKAVIQGILTKVDLAEFQRDEGLSTDYQVDQVVHYELHIDGREKYYFNYFAGPLGYRVDGRVRHRRAARNIGLV